MYVGHVAVALALKTREPRVPMVPLILACYGPDWLETFLGFWHGRAEMAPYTHYLPGLLTGALAASAIYVVVVRRPGGWIILSGWLLHWPADFFTAHKGLLSPTDRVGLDLYDLPPADFVLESVIVLICCAWYARTFAHSPIQRRWVIIMAAALVGLQAMLDYGLSQDDAPWNPSLASHEWRPHLTSLVPGAEGTAARMPLALVAVSSTTSHDGQQSCAWGDHADLPHMREGKVLHAGSAGVRIVRSVRQHGVSNVRYPDRVRRGGHRGARGAGPQHVVRRRVARYHAR